MQRNRSIQHRDVTCAQYDTSRIRSVPFSYRKKASIWILVAYQWSRCSAFAERVIQLKYIDIDDDSTRVVVYRLRETPHDKNCFKSAALFLVFEHAPRDSCTCLVRTRGRYIASGENRYETKGNWNFFPSCTLTHTVQFSLFLLFTKDIWFERDF